MDQHKLQPYPLRLPPELRQWAEVEAKENERSLNSEIIHRLRRSKEQQESSNPTSQGVAP